MITRNEMLNKLKKASPLLRSSRDMIFQSKPLPPPPHLLKWEKQGGDTDNYILPEKKLMSRNLRNQYQSRKT